MRHALGLTLVLVAFGLGANPALAQRDTGEDFALRAGSWNGLAQLVVVAEEAGVVLDTPAELDLSRLRPEDALLLIHPTGDLPRSSLAAFLRAGGRIAIADDYGDAEPFLELYGIARSPHDPGPEALLLRGNPALPLASPGTAHPLTEGVRALVANHPAALRHAELEPVLVLEGDAALVLAGAVDDGRLVAIGDPSLFIENMLRFRDNRRFAANLLRYLGERGGRVYLVAPSTELSGTYGDARGNPLERLDDWLENAAHAELPPSALTILAWVIAAIALLFAVSALPRIMPYGAAALGLEPARGGGFAGRVAFYARRPKALVHPALIYKFELEGELMRRLGLEGQPLLRDVLAAAEVYGLTAAERESLRALLLELDEIRRKIDLPPAPPRVGPRDLRRMVDTGEAILARLPDPANRT
ncbi:MAG: hypothetical protein H6724_15775 [Sandaracinus sp.]|nr:hypothetical protein [Sandaracinus sp.]